MSQTEQHLFLQSVLLAVLLTLLLLQLTQLLLLLLLLIMLSLLMLLLILLLFVVPDVRKLSRHHAQPWRGTPTADESRRRARLVARIIRASIFCTSFLFSLNPITSVAFTRVVRVSSRV